MGRSTMKTRTWTALAICGIVFGFLAAPADVGDSKGEYRWAWET
jgi:predicted transcriptional regulator